MKNCGGGWLARLPCLVLWRCWLTMQGLVAPGWVLQLCVSCHWAMLIVLRGLLDGTTAEWLAMVQVWLKSLWKTNPLAKLKVNLLAPTLCSKLAISNMTEHNKQPRGHIINVLSVWGCEVPRREYTHFYSATKHALKAVAEGLRIELATRKLPIKVAVFLLRWSIPRLQGYQCLPWTSRDKFQCQLLWRRRGGQSIWGSSRLWAA